MFETLPFSVRQTFRVLTPGFCHPEPVSGSRRFSLRSFSVLFLFFLLSYPLYSFFSTSLLPPYLLPSSPSLLSVLFLPSLFLSSSLFLLYFLILLLFSPFSSFLFSLSSFLFLPSSLFSFLLILLLRPLSSFPFLTLFTPSPFLFLLLTLFTPLLFPSLFSLLPPFLLFSPELALSTRSRDDRLGVRRLPAG